MVCYSFSMSVHTDDELLKKAVQVVIEHHAADSSTLQRYLGISYGQAYRLPEKMEQIGVVTEERQVRMRFVIPRSVDEGLSFVELPIPSNDNY